MAKGCILPVLLTLLICGCSVGENRLLALPASGDEAAAAEPAADASSGGSISGSDAGEISIAGPDDVLRISAGRFVLSGKPFAEISFNKFDLFWQLWGELAAGRALDAGNEKLGKQEEALRELHEMGFRTIRIFALPWGNWEFAPVFADPLLRERIFYGAMDRTLALCDKYQLKVVYSLACGGFTDRALVDGQWVNGEEHTRELIANPDSRSRKRLYAYLDEVVKRYKDRKTILMWEIHNELTNAADILPSADPAKDKIYEGQRMPTLAELARFYDDVARRIKSIDPLRLVNNGGSHLREQQWNLYKGNGWKRDTYAEQAQALALLYADSAVDVIDIHYYPNDRPGYIISADTGGDRVQDAAAYFAMAKGLMKPLMVGEFAPLPIARTNTEVWTRTPSYFESFQDPAAATWVQQKLDEMVGSGIQLAYWWCYQSDRTAEQNKPDRFDLDRGRDDALLDLIVSANRELQATLP